MAAIEITISGVLFDKIARTTQPVVLIGEATLTGLGVGGGPIIPPESKPPWGGVDKPPQIQHPIWPPNIPGQGPIQPPTEPPDSGNPPPADENGFIKPPPAEGGWAYHEKYSWGYYPRPGDIGPKK